MKRILITGVGGPAGVNFVNSLRAAEEKVHIVGTDIDSYHLEWPDIDRKILAPPCGDPSYIDFLNQTIESEGVEFVHPQPDVEVRVISENRERLKAATFLPAKEALRVCQDKTASARVWHEKGIHSRPTVVLETESDLARAERELGYPYWIRAGRGAGGTGSTPVRSRDMAAHWIAYWRAWGRAWTFIAQEFLPGRDLAFQSLWKSGRLVVSQARERLEYIYPHLVPSGVTGTPSVAVTVHRDDVNAAATRAILAIDPKPEGIFCVDLKENAGGVPVPTEINAGRFFTTSYFFTRAGVNMPYYYMKLGYGEGIPPLPQYNSVPAGVHWIRHMDCPTVMRNENELGHWPPKVGSDAPRQ
ncbi:hypothetical protein HY522_04405 [bacterium]|nr:hypothetical protein [bacterium]